jgi:hypothetical protein
MHNTPEQTDPDNPLGAHNPESDRVAPGGPDHRPDTDGGGGAGTGGGGGTNGEERISVAAVLGLLFVGANVFGCAGGIALTLMGSALGAAVLMVLPLQGFIAAVCGFIGLRATARPGVTGRGPAFVGLFGGAILFVLQAAFVGGVGVTYISTANTLAPVVDRSLVATSEGRLALAVQGVASSGDVDEDEARLGRFVDIIESHYGTIASARFSVPILIEGRKQIGELFANQPAGVAIDEPPKWLEIACARGTTIVFVTLDDDALDNDRVEIDDMLALLPDGQAVELVPGGRLTPIAEVMGLELVDGPAE